MRSPKNNRENLSKDNRPKILVVDDNKEFCEIICDFINNQDDMILLGAAHEGSKALNMILEYEPDIIIIDLELPVLSGLTVLECINTLKVKNKYTFIIMSAFNSSKTIDSAFESGASYFFVKPFNLELLFNLIKELSLIKIQQIDKYKPRE